MSDPKFSVQELLSQPTHWDQLIAADLSAEIRALLAEKVDTIPEMRRFLRSRAIGSCIKGWKPPSRGKPGKKLSVPWLSPYEPTHMIALACRPPHSEPQSLILRNGVVKASRWDASSSAFSRASGSPAIRLPTRSEILRALVRGFVLHEMALSFLEPLDYDETYSIAVEVIVD
jgi:hypothetical protein